MSYMKIQNISNWHGKCEIYLTQISCTISKMLEHYGKFSKTNLIYYAEVTDFIESYIIMAVS